MPLLVDFKPARIDFKSMGNRIPYGRRLKVAYSGAKMALWQGVQQDQSTLRASVRRLCGRSWASGRCQEEKLYKRVRAACVDLGLSW